LFETRPTSAHDYREWEKGEMAKLFAQARGEWIDAVEAKIKHDCR
jgi:hypothetical protein